MRARMAGPLASHSMKASMWIVNILCTGSPSPVLYGEVWNEHWASRPASALNGYMFEDATSLFLKTPLYLTICVVMTFLFGLK